MKNVNFTKSHTHPTTKVNDTLKVSFTPIVGGLNEIKFTRTSTNSRDPKEYKFYFNDIDMFEFEETVKLYNEGLNRGET